MRAGNADDRKQRVLRLLQAAAKDGGMPSAAHMLAQLTTEGSSGKVRRSRSGRSYAVVPIMGTIAAGRGDATDPVKLGSIPVDLQALRIRPGAKTFALRVRGDSMIDAQISDGDIVIVELREAREGDIVAALIDGETTLKRLVSVEGAFFLRAENSRYPDLIPLEGLTVQGVMRAVVRVCDSGKGTRSGPGKA